MTIQASFSSHVWNKNISIEFCPDTSIDTRYYATPHAYVSILVDLFFYSDLVLRTSIMQKYLFYTISGLALGNGIIGLISKNLAGIESIIACQLSTLSVLMVNTYFL